MSLSNFVLNYITEFTYKELKDKFGPDLGGYTKNQLNSMLRNGTSEDEIRSRISAKEDKKADERLDRQLADRKGANSPRHGTGGRSTNYQPLTNTSPSNGSSSSLNGSSSSSKKSSSPLSGSSSNGSSFWSNAKSHLGNHKIAYGVGAGGLAAAGVGAAYLHHRSKNKGIINKIKNNPGKTAAGASLAALGAGAGVAALIRHLRKKKKQ